MLMALAWRNLWRQPVRTGLTLVSIVLASGILVFMLSFQLGVYAQMKANALRLFDGFAQIQPPGYAADPDIKKVIADPEAAIKAALALPGITAATPRATSFAILSNGDLSYGGAVVGIDPAREPQVTTLTTTLKEGKPLSGADAAEILLGDALARDLHLSVGQKVTLLGEAADGSVAADSVKLVGYLPFRHPRARPADVADADRPVPRQLGAAGRGQCHRAGGSEPAGGQRGAARNCASGCPAPGWWWPTGVRCSRR